MSPGGDGRSTAALLDAIRAALASTLEGLDAVAVERDTPLGAVIFDSLTATTFLATLEGILGVQDLPFEAWLLRHSERVEGLTVGLLADWLAALPALRPGDAAGAGTDGR